MRKRPLSIKFIGITLLLAGPFTVLLALDPLGLTQGFLFQIEATTIFLGLLATAVGIGVWRVRLWGYFGFLTFSASVLLYQLYVYLTNPDPSLYAMLVSCALVSGVTSFLLQRHLTAPYFNPQMRWWETDTRYQVDLHSEIVVEGHPRVGKIMDISRGGCFIGTDTRLIVGEIVQMKLRFKELSLEVPAEVIWISKAPEGYGLRFILAKSEQRKHTGRLVKSLSHIAPVTYEKARTAA